MKIRFYSELTDKYYDSAKECGAAEDKFKEDQLEKDRKLAEIKRKADAESKRIAEEEARRLKKEEEDKIIADMNEAYKRVMDAARVYLNVCNRHYDFLKKNGDDLEAMMLKCAIRACKNLLEDKEDEE